MIVMMETATTYCDLLETDDYYVTDRHLFESTIFRSHNTRRYSYEHSANPRNKESFKTTPNGRQWGNVWGQIEGNQNRAPGKRRNRYHISWQSHRVIEPAQFESVLITETIDNPLGGQPFTITRNERSEIPAVYAPVELLYFDIDDMTETEAFMALPNAIWCRSPGGRFHIFIFIYACDYGRARDRVKEWMNHNHVRAENNIVVRNGKTLDSILIPGQDEWTLPCRPGEPDSPIVMDYQETIALFVNRYRNERLDIDEALPVSREISMPKPIAPEPKPETIAASAVTSTQKMKRNRPRIGNLCNLPEIHGSLRITRNRGLFDERTFEYRTVQDCKDEGDGFHIGWSYFAALTRKHGGDTEAAYMDFVGNRQTLRTSNSKKHCDKFLLQHAKAMQRYAERTYDPSKMRHSDRDKKDAEAMKETNSVQPRSYTAVIQRQLRLHKPAITKLFGKQTYQAAQSCTHSLTSDIHRNNGRIAMRSRKSRNEYIHSDSRSMIDYAGIAGNKRLLSRVVTVLRMYILKIDDPPNWGEAKCTRYTYRENIALQAEDQDQGRGEEGSNRQERIISFTNVVLLPISCLWSALATPV